MIRVAARPPNQNADLIQNGLEALGFKQATGLLKQFNIGIGTEMAVVPGRILPPPQILYANNKSMKAENASWNLRDIKFQLGATLDKWAVLNLRDNGRVSC
jgi:eukaryotic translation initiation factor 2C